MSGNAEHDESTVLTSDSEESPLAMADDGALHSKMQLLPRHSHLQDSSLNAPSTQRLCVTALSSMLLSVLLTLAVLELLHRLQALPSPSLSAVHTAARDDVWSVTETVASAAELESCLRAANMTVSAPLPYSAYCVDDGAQRVAWFMALRAHEEYETFAAVAILSARDRAPRLQPHVLWLSSAPSNYTDWLEAQGVVVHHHRLRMMDELVARFGDEVTLGAFGRLDVAHVYTQWLRSQRAAGVTSLPHPDSFLYTDTDVMFVASIDRCSFPPMPEPMVMLVGPEQYPSTMHNTGVVWVNVTRWLAVEDDFFSWCRQQEWTAVAWEQGLVVGWFGTTGRMQQLPNQLNWKGYWGWTRHDQPSARIVHFHGPKPKRCLDSLVWTHNLAACPPEYHPLIEKFWASAVGQPDPELQMYAFMLTAFEHYFNIAARCAIQQDPANTYSAIGKFLPRQLFVC